MISRTRSSVLDLVLDVEEVLDIQDDVLDIVKDEDLEILNVEDAVLDVEDLEELKDKVEDEVLDIGDDVLDIENLNVL